MRKALYLLVLAIVLIAGCTSGDKTQMQNRELLRISGLTVTPGTVVAPGEIITIRMKLDNIGQEDVNFVKDVKVDGKYTAIKTNDELKGILYDHCGNLYNYDATTSAKFDVITSGFDVENGQLLLKPSRSALLEWTLKAPSETTIANMQHECNFKFQINYQAKAETYTYIYFANPDEKNQRTYTNKDMNLRGENVANFGPVYINFETAQDQPIKGSKNDAWESTWTLYATARNVGDGIGRITTDTLKIELPNEKFKPASSCTDFNTYDSAFKTVTHKVPESEKDDSRLKLYSKQSSRFSCTLPAPKVDVLEPYRFISSADYIYTIDKELKILTVPKRT